MQRQLSPIYDASHPPPLSKPPTNDQIDMYFQWLRLYPNNIDNPALRGAIESGNYQFDPNPSNIPSPFQIWETLGNAFNSGLQDLNPDSYVWFQNLTSDVQTILKGALVVGGVVLGYVVYKEI